VDATQLAAALYRQMMRSRTFEVAVADLWTQGLVSGEMHLGTGEEAVAVGVVTHLRDGDGLALTHRCSPALAARGVSLVAMLREMLGKEDGLCGGRGGHMHLASREHLVAASGIVGASLPMAAGFALAARRLRPGAVGVAFTGEGAMNQGQALETLNLAAAWSLPLVVVCVDNGWAITTRSESVTGGDLAGRARAFGWEAVSLDGTDVVATYHAADAAIRRARRGLGPSLLLARCPRLDGHFLGDPLVRQARHPFGAETLGTLRSVMSAVRAPDGGGALARARSVAKIGSVIGRASFAAQRGSAGDPVVLAGHGLGHDERAAIDQEVEREVRTAVEQALGTAPGGESGDA
jgi:pyruvate dehydrogenase E1 component alpha subunit